MCRNCACGIHDLPVDMAEFLPVEFTISLGVWHCVYRTAGNGLICLPEVVMNADSAVCALLTMLSPVLNTPAGKVCCGSSYPAPCTT